MSIKTNHHTSPCKSLWWRRGKAGRVISVGTGFCLLLGLVSPSWAAPEPKVDICHRSQKGKNVIFKVQSVKQSAVSNHIAHGDNLVELEVCDGVDNDCNGIVDDNPTDIGVCLSTGVGECARQGQESCLAGVVSCDAVEGQPTVEACDGLDNDCNGEVDNGVADMVTGTNEGECQEGIQSCIDGTFQVSQAEIGPSPEVCDGLDNDCNATVDDAELANADCSGDGIVCTVASCVTGACSNVPDNGQCTLGDACSPTLGCVVPKVVFLTSEDYTGDLGGLAGADEICQTLAEAEGSVVPHGTGETYIAWLWTDNVAPDDPERLPNVKTDTYVQTDGQIVDFSLWETQISRDLVKVETGGGGGVVTRVWTGAPQAGMRSNCNNWQSSANAEKGAIGRSGESDERWYIADQSPIACDGLLDDGRLIARFYCFQK